MNGPDRHLLIAVDESRNSGRAVEYVADILGGMPGFRATLLHVLGHPPEEFFPSEEARAAWTEERRAAMRALLEGWRKVLVEAGFPREKVQVEIAEREVVPVADAILEERQRLGSCTLVVGRRGKSREEEFLFGSVSARLARMAKNCSVWIVG